MTPVAAANPPSQEEPLQAVVYFRQLHPHKNDTTIPNLETTKIELLLQANYKGGWISAKNVEQSEGLGVLLLKQKKDGAKRRSKQAATSGTHLSSKLN